MSTIEAPAQQPISPTQFDSLEGVALSGRAVPEHDPDAPTLMDEINTCNPVVENDSFGGRTFEYRPGDRYGVVSWDKMANPGIRTILSQIGIRFKLDEQGGLVGLRAPDPERAVAIATNKQIPIQLEDDASGRDYEIAEARYNTIVTADEKHPVGTHDLTNYTHDLVRVDHIPAVIVLKQRLFEILKLGTYQPQEAAIVYERLTMTLTDAILDYLDTNQEEGTKKYREKIFDTCPRQLRGYTDLDNEPNQDELETVGAVINAALREGLADLGIN